jgi:hypothetical protein
MKRFHVHVRVADLESSARFYSMLFGVEPGVLKPDYAKSFGENMTYGNDIAPLLAISKPEAPRCAPVAVTSATSCCAASKG